MATIRPFRPYRPAAELVHMVAELPYDVCSRDEARAAAGSEYNFYHITRSEIDLPDEIPPYDDAVYLKAAENFRKFISEGTLLREETDSLYLYTLVMNGRAQTGIITVVSIDDYLENRVKKHEFTREEKENDRIRHIDALEAQTGPVFLMHIQSDEKRRMYDSLIKLPPLYDFTAGDGVRHIVRRIEDKEKIDTIVDLFSDDVLYIADGHHRAASAVKNGCIRREKGKAGCTWFLSVIFPHSDLMILPYYRVLRDLNGLSGTELIEKLSGSYYITTVDSGDIEKRGRFRMYCGGVWNELVPDFETGDDPVESLDVSILQRSILQPVFGIEDIRRDRRIDFVGGIRGTKELERLVDSGEFAAAFSVFPTTVEDLICVSDNDLIMPPKSTWFEPKLRSGLCVYSFSEGD